MPIALLRSLLRQTFPGLRGRRETAAWTLMIAVAVGIAAAWDHQQLQSVFGTPAKGSVHKDAAARPANPRVIPDAAIQQATTFRLEIGRTTAHDADPGQGSAPTTEYQQGTLIEVRNLSADGVNEMCQPDSSPIVGTIVQRRYGNDGVTITGLVVETDDRDRAVLNVDATRIATLNQVDQGHIRGLLKEGTRTAAWYYACGAAGRVWDVDRIRRL